MKIYYIPSESFGEQLYKAVLNNFLHSMPEETIDIPQVTVGTCGVCDKPPKSTKSDNKWINKLNERCTIPGFPEISRVEFNGPVTMVFFADGTISKVKTHAEDTPSRELGVVWALLKRLYGAGKYGLGGNFGRIVGEVARTGIDQKGKKPKKELPPKQTPPKEDQDCAEIKNED